MNQKALCLFTVDYLPELLQRPGCSGMRGDIDVRYPSATNLHDHKHVEHAEISGNRHEEVAGENRLSMVANKGRPTLRPMSISRSSMFGQVASDRSRSQTNTEFQ